MNMQNNLSPQSNISDATNAKNRSRAVISITEKAAMKIRELLNDRGVDSVGVRVSVKSGGCSGFSYDIEYADTIRPFEEQISTRGITVLLDPKALMYIIGSEMDYFEDQFKSGFVFNNPNEKGKCGCGKSFSV